MKTDGQCSYCHGVFGKTAMKRHLDACFAREQSGKDRYYLLRVQGADAPGYWMYLQVAGNATLAQLDAFLRELWLECCGHMSLFDLGGSEYLSFPEGGERGMNVRVSRVLREGLEFRHEYDFGSTTVLKLKVVATGCAAKRKIEIMARNLPPAIKCSHCDKTAVWVCCDCLDEWLCGDCAREHECGEEMLLPVVNSPRVGVCAYSG